MGGQVVLVKQAVGRTVYLVGVCNPLQLYQKHQQALQPCLTVPTIPPVIDDIKFLEE